MKLKQLCCFVGTKERPVDCQKKSEYGIYTHPYQISYCCGKHLEFMIEDDKENRVFRLEEKGVIG